MAMMGIISVWTLDAAPASAASDAITPVNLELAPSAMIIGDTCEDVRSPGASQQEVERLGGPVIPASHCYTITVRVCVPISYPPGIVVWYCTDHEIRICPPF